MKKPKTKTRYCGYYHNCDRPENCFKGKFCPLFKINPDISPEILEDSSGENGLKDIMDNIWNGDKDIAERKM